MLYNLVSVNADFFFTNEINLLNEAFMVEKYPMTHHIEWNSKIS